MPQNEMFAKKCPKNQILRLGPNHWGYLFSTEIFRASMSFQGTWVSQVSSMLKAFLKAFNIEEAYVSWKVMEAHNTWEAQRPKRPKRPRHHQLMEGQTNI